MCRVLITVAMLASALCGSSFAQTITVYADSLGQSNCIEVPEVPVLDLYVLFVPGGTVNELQGARFVSVGFPSDWIVLSVASNPLASVVLGDPFDPSQDHSQCTISFSACQTGVVVLWKATVLAVSQIEDHAMRIEPMPFCPGFPCWGPEVFLCDAPIYTGVFLSSSESMINPTGGCTVAVEASSWSSVKRLFQQWNRVDSR